MTLQYKTLPLVLINHIEDYAAKDYKIDFADAPADTSRIMCETLTDMFAAMSPNGDASVVQGDADEMIAAIAREKQIKASSRKKKLTMIESVNPTWNDLYETLL